MDPMQATGWSTLRRAKLTRMQNSPFLKNITVTPEERETLKREPQGTGIWQAERHKRLTASNFGLVCRRRSTTSCKTQVHKIFYETLQTKAMHYGRVTEDDARNKLAEGR